MLQLDTLRLDNVKYIDERVDKIVKDSALPLSPLHFIEPPMMNDLHLLYDCRFSTIAGAYISQ